MRKMVLCLSLLLGILSSLSAKVRPWSLAVVIDPKSLTEAKAEVDAYVHAIETVNDLQVHLVVDRWGVPDSIRQTLYRLYRKDETPLCGAVFVGDIPIAMIRDAQHLTSAFKMDQREDWKESSVPSDRYYDDFDLRFDALRREEGTPYHYYSLRADSPQQLQSDIFSGRIRPTDTPESNRYEKLRRYLRKATAAKYQNNELDHVFFFTGQGSLNESRVAAMDEKASYYEHFPWLAASGQAISYMDYSQEASIKERLMNELMRPELDFAVLHHHGSEDVQYLNSYAPARTVHEAKAFITRQLRYQLRRHTHSSSRDSVISTVAVQNGIPRAWLIDTFTTQRLAQDSLEEARLNLTTREFNTYGFRPSCRMVIFDACYNASFHRDESVANAYLFSEGETVVAVGGTVNLLQDKWYDRLAGLLGMGLYAGTFNLFQNQLESHLIGDPTFTFTPKMSVPYLNEAIASTLSGRASIDLPAHLSAPDLDALRLELRFREGKVNSEELLRLLHPSHSTQVRMEALYLLAQVRGEALVQGLLLATDDRTEMIQRFAVNYLAAQGDSRLAAPLIRLFLQNNPSQRVAFNVQQAMMYYPKEVLLTEFQRQFARVNCLHKEDVRREKLEKINASANRWSKEVDRLLEGDLKESSFDFIVSCLRLYCPHSRVPDVLRYLKECPDSKRQIRLLEAMGWMRLSYQAPLIARTALQLSEDPRLPRSVRKEALKTYRRIK